MVDAWVGELVAALRRLGIWEETAIIFTSDHGAYMDYPGDAGLICKPLQVAANGRWMAAGQPLQAVRRFPIRLNLARIPLIVHLPGQDATKRVKAITQPWDILPTIFEFFGARPPETSIGHSLVPLIRGGKGKRDHAFFGSAASIAHVADERWVYATWRQSQLPLLFDRKKDPYLTKNIAPKNPSVVRDLHAALLAFMKSTKTEEKHLEGWNTIS
jgi:arylsulfatase A-like enzyme